MKTYLLALVATAALAASPTYKVVGKIKIGGDGRWDYCYLDSANHRLYVSHGTQTEVVDTATDKLVGTIPDTKGVHGIAVANDLGRGFTSDGADNDVTVFDLKTLKVLNKVKTGQNPDAIIYDPASRRVFTFNGPSGDSTAIDAASGTVAGTLPLGGRPEFAVADGKGNVYANLEDKSTVVAIDSQKLTVESRWPLAPGEEPSGMAMDRDHRRLFSGCHNRMMVVMYADSGKVVATPPIGQGVDANAFDPGTGLAFSSNGDGTLTVVRQESPDKYSVVDSVQTQRGARTMALDLKTHNVYLVTAEFGPPPAPTADQPRPRPSMVPGSFVVLVVSRQR